MDHTSAAVKAASYLDRLCYGFGDRRTGSDGNRQVTDYFATVASAFNFQVECPKFSCIDWRHGDATLEVAGEAYEVLVSPYAVGCDVNAELATVTNVAELERASTEGKVLLLRGDIAGEQIMPKNFIFYNPDHHKRIVSLLEAKRPAAIVSATTRDPELAGGSYPFSLIEDGDFEVPCVYMTAEEGDRLAQVVGKRAELHSDAERIPSWGCNVLARRQAGGAQKITVCAHIDAKDNTPGALDNGTGVVVLMLLMEMLRDYDCDRELEIVAINGEDYYSAAGEMQYWNDFAHDFERIALAINVDAAGYRDGATAYSLYGCDNEVAEVIRRTLGVRPGMTEGEQWFQSDHSIFIQRGRPALAITSEQFRYLTTYVTHTGHDRPELVDLNKVVEIAAALRDLVTVLGRC